MAKQVKQIFSHTDPAGDTVTLSSIDVTGGPSITIWFKGSQDMYSTHVVAVGNAAAQELHRALGKALAREEG